MLAPSKAVAWLPHSIEKGGQSRLFHTPLPKCHPQAFTNFALRAVSRPQGS